MRRIYFISLLLLITVSAANAQLDVPSDQLGLRLGWGGGPNGISWKKYLDETHAFEFIAGYNIKEGRRINKPFFSKGNTFLGARYQPYLSIADASSAWVFYASIGTHLRVHNYRPVKFNDRGWWITPDFVGGGGLELNFAEMLALFADVSAKFYNSSSNRWSWGIESGLGLRFDLN